MPCLAAHLLQTGTIRFLDFDALLFRLRNDGFNARIRRAVFDADPAYVRAPAGQQLLHGAQARYVIRFAHLRRLGRDDSRSDCRGRKSIRLVSMSTRCTCTCMASPRL